MLRARLLTLCFILSVPNFVRAQHESPEARHLFDEGTHLVDTQRYAEAIDFFVRSLALAERPATLFSLGSTYLRLSKPIESARAFERFLAITDPLRNRADRDVAARLLAQAEHGIASISLPALPETAEVRVDESAVAHDDFDRIVLDPGAHTLDVIAEGYAPYHTRFTVLTGEHATRRVVLERIAVATPAAVAVAAEVPSDVAPRTPVVEHEPVADSGEQGFTRQHRFYEEPLFWGIVSLVAVGVGVSLGVALSLEHKPPDTGTTGVVLSGLSAHF